MSAMRPETLTPIKEAEAPLGAAFLPETGTDAEGRAVADVAEEAGVVDVGDGAALDEPEGS